MYSNFHLLGNDVLLGCFRTMYADFPPLEVGVKSEDVVFGLDFGGIQS